MEVTINTGSEFKRQFKRLMKKYHSLLHDFDVWKQELKNNLLAGDDLGAGVRKIRMAINSKGEISNVNDDYIKFLVENL